MGIFIVYIIKCAFCLAFFYLFNRLLLGKETFHKVNRWVWLLLIPVSIILPFCQLEIWDLFEKAPNTIAQAGIDFSNIPVVNVATEMDTVNIEMYYTVKILIYAYFVGFIFFASLYLYSYIRLFTTILTGKRERLQLEEHKKAVGIKKEVYIIMQKKCAVPFSWMNYIFIGEEDLKENGTEILRHELSHIKNGHSYDVMAADILILFQWFNPAAWLLKQALQQVHEFQADETVILSGIHAKNYQLLLIKKAVGKRLFSMVNSFNHSKLKNRINMMLKEKSSKWAYLKCLYAFPLAAAVVSAYAAPSVSSKLNEVESSVGSDIHLQQYAVNLVESEKLHASEVVYYPFNYINKMEQDSINNGKFIVKGMKIKKNSIPVYVLDGKVIAKEKIDKIDPESIDKICVAKKEVALSPISASFLGKDIDKAEKNGVVFILSKNGNASEKFRKLIKTMLEGVDKNKNIIRVKSGVKHNDELVDNLLWKYIEEAPLYILDNKEITHDQIPESNSIERISVLKDKSAVEIYGDKGKNGVVIIETKNAPQKTMVRIREITVKNNIKMDSTGVDKLLREGISISPCFIVDGKEVKSVNSIEPNSIENITVLKNKPAINIYGDKGKNGVVIVKTKTIKDKPILISESANRTVKNNNVEVDNLFGTSMSDSPLFVVDGKEVKSVNNINPNDTESVTVLKNKDAVNIYGDKGKNGVIIIVTKNKKTKNKYSK